VHDDRALVEGRLDRVLRERIRPAVHGFGRPLEVAVWHVPGEPVPVADGLAASYRPAKPGEEWGPAWGTSWFRLTGAVPEDWAGRTVEAVVDLGFDGVGPGFSAEALVYRPDGTAVKGLHPRSQWIRVGSPVTGGETVELYVEAAANPLIAGPVTRLGDVATAGDDPLYRLVRADLTVFDRQVWELVADLEVLGGLMHALHDTDPRRWDLARAIGRALDALDLDDVPGTAEHAREALAPALACPAHASAHRVSAVGHAHIDSAWLWPQRETVRKVARTAANVTALMDDEPDLVFAMSQAQQLAWIKAHRPEVYARVREKVAEGRFVPVGGMWVEADTNMPGGEAMARQFVHGKRFFLDEFGIDTQEVWLPDSFGYSAALPQLVKLSGSRWFLTQKISWNQTNKFPHHTFWWEGIDGTRVFTHFPPADTYNAELTGHEMAHLVANFAEKGGSRRSLVPFGHGDGGGGPVREMLARARRLADLEGSARVVIEKPAAFFAAAQAEYPDAPVWVGELYLELHRGTYTSQAATKQGNRRSEHLLREAELWSATATVQAGARYPYDRLDRLWKTVLLHQFHDILPGSSIAWVHREARATYARVAAELEEMISTAQLALTVPGDSDTVFNAAPHTRDGIPAGGAGVRRGTADPVTVTEEAIGWTLDNGVVTVGVDRRGLIVSVVDRHSGREAVPAGHAANLLQLHPDLPNNWDAWDVDSFYRNQVTDLTDADEITATPAGVTVRRSFGSSTATQTIELAPGAAQVDLTTEVDWHETEKFLKAAFPLDVHADRCAAETQFGHLYRPTHTNTTWDAARFEICAHRWVHVGEPGWGAAVVNDSTYGHDVTRSVSGPPSPTPPPPAPGPAPARTDPGPRAGTSAVAGSGSGSGAGVDGGTRQAGVTTVRLSLLRAPRFPDPETDQGVHRFRYALVPGADVGAAIREGYRMNLPERVVRGRGGTVTPLVAVDADGVVVEAVKLADDESGDVIVRLYESLGGRAACRLTVAGFTATGVTEVDLLERPLDPAGAPVLDEAPDRPGTVGLALRPFQIRTLRLHRDATAAPTT
jgi:alpha-mannosidase